MCFSVAREWTEVDWKGQSCLPEVQGKHTGVIENNKMKLSDHIKISDGTVT